MQTERIELDGIEVGERMRPLDPARVDALVSSIRSINLRTPLTVLAQPGVETYRLVAGRHRLEALRRLGHEFADCIVIDGDELDAELWEVAENLHRVDLTKEQRDQHIRRFAELLEQRESLQSTQNAAIESKREDGRGHRPKGTVAKIAEQTGISKDTVRRALSPKSTKPAAEPLSDIDATEKQYARIVSAWNAAGVEARQRFREYIDEPIMNARFG